MSPCCCPEPNEADNSKTTAGGCPRCHHVGKSVDLITLKSLLTPIALAELNPEQIYRFCPEVCCSVVYFSAKGQTFTTTDLTVSVFQKDLDENVPVCYCFGWTRQRIKTTVEQQGAQSVMASITHHIQAGRCGCEVNNPQGSCCLANVKALALTTPSG
ncbi:putative iron-sulfur cluster-binding metallochaperone [Sphaerothrix gracilis]|uniref:putative iron-sulfur cluster-binding metallochaperone n=1 Tax=Sphaerothrix gracilis TaxID=3151835 RepID=UPI0031FD70D4